MKRIFSVIGAAAILLISCKKELIATFVNSTSDSVAVALYGDSEDKTGTRFNIGPDGVRKTGLMGTSGLRGIYARVSWSSGRPGYTAELPKDLSPFMKNVSEHRVYILITTEGMYPIPPEFRDNWRQHLQEIIGASRLRKE